jgi:Protein of unknown function (DUF2752)
MHAISGAVPPKIKNPTQSSLLVFAVIFFGALALGAGAVVFFFNPVTHHFYPVCLFHQLTGLNCPGCGATRSLYALLHGNFKLAFHDNVLFILMLAALAARGLWFAARFISGRPAENFSPVKSLWIFLAVAVVFGILRNLPAFSFLSP